MAVRGGIVARVPRQVIDNANRGTARQQQLDLSRFKNFKNKECGDGELKGATRQEAQT
jgi:hypothetical protein